MSNIELMELTQEELADKRKAVQEELSKYDAEIKRRKSLTLVRCENTVAYGKGCGAGFEIRDLEYIQTYWYEPPSGCSDGDNWWQGEGQWKCPSCGHTNRLYDKPDVTKLKSLFKNTVDSKK
jgi:hypothetical protein